MNGSYASRLFPVGGTSCPPEVAVSAVTPFGKMPPIAAYNDLNRATNRRRLRIRVHRAQFFPADDAALRLVVLRNLSDPSAAARDTYPDRSARTSFLFVAFRRAVKPATRPDSKRPRSPSQRDQ
jgi:hypothetical protein